MNKLTEIDCSGSLVILNEELFEILNENSTDYLINYQFKNPVLLSKIWSVLIKDPSISEIPQGKLYRYLTEIGYDSKPNGYLEYELHKFWNIPNVIESRLMNLIAPETWDVISNGVDSIDICTKVMKDLEVFSGCNICTKYLSKYAALLAELKDKDLKNKRWVESQKLLKNHMISLQDQPPQSIINTLLILNGFKGSIYEGRKLEYLLWISTGYRLTDIILDVIKFVKIRDEIVCKLKPEFQSVTEAVYDYEKFGLRVSSIYSHYKSECEKVGESNGRLSKMYPGYSLSTLKSSVRAPKYRAPQPKISEFEVLQFINDNINTEFDWEDIKDYLIWFNKLGVLPQLKDEGEGYCGLNFDSDKVGEINKYLLRYDQTDFSNIRKVLVGIIDEQVEATKLSESELREFDSDLACDMIEKLLSWDEITYSHLMSDMKWLRIVGHIGVTLRKVKKGSYKIQFNTVSFIKVVELIYRSDKGYHVAKLVLDRLGQTKAFYRDVLTGFTPAIWNLHKCQMQLKYE